MDNFPPVREAVSVGGNGTVRAVSMPLPNSVRAQAAHEAAKHERRRKLIALERRILFPLLAIALLMLPNFGRAKVVGRSMEPALKSGDSLILLKTYRVFAPLKVGDMVVVRKKEGQLEGEDIVKRVVFIQNAAGNAPLPKTIKNSRGEIPFGRLFPRESFGFVKIPANHLYVVGDNLRVSVDSRDPDVGAVDPSEVVGKVINKPGK